MSVTGDWIAHESLSAEHWIGVGLAAVTAVVHLVLGIGFLPHWMGVAFLVATLGFLVGIGLVLVDYRRRLVYLAGIPFTGAQIVLWYDLNRLAGLGEISILEGIDKVAQLVLIVVLVVLYRRE